MRGKLLKRFCARDNNWYNNKEVLPYVVFSGGVESKINN